MSINHIKTLIETGDGYLPHPLSVSSDLVFRGPIHDIPLLIFAYKYGYFPWYEINQEAAFFYPRKRYLIKPEEIKIPKSMNSYFNQGKFTITIDCEFKKIITHCMEIPRSNQGGTWITENFVNSYYIMHRIGIAHSVEVWDTKGQLAGGLYGVSMGKIFFGESMFSLQPNASRFGLISLAKILAANSFHFIDCQVENPYLSSFGGYSVNDKAFFEIIKKNLFEPTLTGSWSHLANPES